MTDTTDTQLLRIADVASRLKVSPGTIRNLIRSRALESVHIGRAHRVREADLARFIDELKAGR